MVDHNKLSAARTLVVSEMPYFASVLYGMIPVDSDVVPTLGVSKKLVLSVNPKHVAKLTAKMLANELIHEINHVLRDHHARMQRVIADPSQWELANVAFDCEINDDMKERAEKDWLFPATFGFPDGLSGEEYFVKLRKLVQPPKPGNGPGKGSCGSCAGAPSPGDEDTSGVGKSQLEVESIRKSAAAAVRDHARQRGQGSIPSELLRWADGELAPPKIPWSQKLARAIRRVMAYRPGSVDFQYGQPAREQWGIGYGPGKPILPSLVSPVPDVTVAIDTSGSMGPEELRAALSETRAILAAVGTPVRFLACDADVHSDVQASALDTIVRNLKGGGGTSFIPVFDRLARSRNKPHVIVYATDGMGAYPPHEPSWCRVVWLLIGSYTSNPPWGEVVKV